jgi:hypothetical protein
MTDLQTETTALPSLEQAQSGFQPLQALRTFGLSILINGAMPLGVYLLLSPEYPKNSVEPLLFASLFPVLGLIYGIVRKRMVDFIAVIALFEITLNVSAILIAPSIKWALVARSLNGLATATVFFISALIGRPIIYYISRQFVGAGNPARLSGFEAVNRADGGRTFRFLTFVWAFAIFSLSLLHAGFALELSTAGYLAAAPVTSWTMNIVLIVWTIRTARTRLLSNLTPAAAI